MPFGCASIPLYFLRKSFGVLGMQTKVSHLCPYPLPLRLPPTLPPLGVIAEGEGYVRVQPKATGEPYLRFKVSRLYFLATLFAS